jgi:putative ABC transport system permease protein
LLAAHGVVALLGGMLMTEQSLAISGWQWVHTELWVPVLAVGVAVVAAGLPALSAYRLDVTELLNSR